MTEFFFWAKHSKSFLVANFPYFLQVLVRVCSSWRVCDFNRAISSNFTAKLDAKTELSTRTIVHHGPRDKQRLGLENYNDVGANVATITSMDKNKLKKKKKKAKHYASSFWNKRKQPASTSTHNKPIVCVKINKKLEQQQHAFRFWLWSSSTYILKKRIFFFTEYYWKVHLL